MSVSLFVYHLISLDFVALESRPFLFAATRFRTENTPFCRGKQKVNIVCYKKGDLFLSYFEKIAHMLVV